LRREKLREKLQKDDITCYDYSAFHIFIGSQTSTSKIKSTIMESKIFELIEDRIKFFTRIKKQYNQKIKNTLDLSDLSPTKRARKIDRAA